MNAVFSLLSARLTLNSLVRSLSLPWSFSVIIQSRNEQIQFQKYLTEILRNVIIYPGKNLHITLGF